MNKIFAHKFQFNQPHVFDSDKIILFAYNPYYKRDDYAEIVVEDKRTKPEDRDKAFGGFFFAELNTDKKCNTSPWTKDQTYIALGNMLHILACLKIDTTPMEGIDTDLVNEEFKKELDGY